MSGTLLRLAVWSGPRSISTAMMRSWGNRADTMVSDEPLYAHYLKATGLDHPGRDEVIAHHDSDALRVIDHLTSFVPPGKAIWYQKHMAHHLLPGMPREWVSKLTNVFLIRDPREMLASLLKVYPRADLPDTGLPQQAELFEQERARTGRTPPVIDARDVLMDPRGMLSRLCAAVGVAFDERMLSWPAGPRQTDGAWAPYWYSAVNASTGFEPYSPKADRLDPRHEPLLARCMPFYQSLHSARIA
ncbi:MAG: hypothetical protein KF699_00265 [Phycisphaeraceae bacterium]|nr:hypothetical protein [Phycisphaeraceae bacterium]